MRRAPLLLLLTAPGLLSAQADLPLRHRVLQVENQRPADPMARRPLFQGLRSADPVARRYAVRALGRLEDRTLVDSIAALLDDPDPVVRFEAVNALGQAVSAVERPATGGPVRRLLENRLGLESDPMVRGGLFRTLGRLAIAPGDDPVMVERLLLQGTTSPAGDAADVTLEGVTHGFAALYRSLPRSREPLTGAFERLIELTGIRYPAVVRRNAMMAIAATGRADSGALLDALDDPDWQARRIAVNAAATQQELPGRVRIIERGWTDPAPQVRLEAVRGLTRHLLADGGCVRLIGALSDPDLSVRLAVVDALAACGPSVAMTLRAMARDSVAPDDWHQAAHALMALARAAPASADSAIELQSHSSVSWVRMYAARAATVTRNAPVLEQLAGDQVANVADAALAGLRLVARHDADPIYLGALERRDYQLLITAVGALDSTPDPRTAVHALLRTLDRVSRERRETSRDVRLAILDVVSRLGTAEDASALRPWLGDFDPAVAARAGGLITRWTGERVAPTPRLLRSVPFPSAADLDRWSGTRARFVMRGLGEFSVALEPWDAPTNTARFVRMVRDGWFNGLTWHRVVPNFVIQGGSPGANEYMGDGPFSRDELGLTSHRRGTVGISTRGRDTGDGQLFVNLVDNTRLDHNYTIIGRVRAGMELVDQLQEGAVIERVVLDEGPIAMKRAPNGLVWSLSGQGPRAVVLIHGSNLDYRMWRREVTELEGSYRVLTYDFRGHGTSADPTEPYSNWEDLAGVMDAAGIESAAVVGLSAGAGIALEFALARPGRVEQLVLVSPGLPGYVPTERPAFFADLVAALQARDWDRANRVLLDSPVMASAPADTALVREMVDGNRRLWTLNPSFAKPLNPPAIGRLGELRVPTLVLTGADDMADILKQADRAVVEIPFARGVRIPGGGHLLNLTSPDAFGRSLREFLATP